MDLHTDYSIESITATDHQYGGNEKSWLIVMYYIECMQWRYNNIK